MVSMICLWRWCGRSLLVHCLQEVKLDLALETEISILSPRPRRLSWDPCPEGVQQELPKEQVLELHRHRRPSRRRSSLVALASVIVKLVIYHVVVVLVVVVKVEMVVVRELVPCRRRQHP